MAANILPESPETMTNGIPSEPVPKTTAPLQYRSNGTVIEPTSSADCNRSAASPPPPGSILTGKQEHYLKRQLLSEQVSYEISELASTTALQRFGAPFRSDAGEVAPEDSELPILRYVFVNHVRNFPFLDQAREKEFWQDKLQVFLESFASKHISGSDDRLEVTKRKKLALKAEKVVELMMVSGLPTASGYEERIRFAEMEVVDRGANEQGLLTNAPAGHEINGWDVNVAGVRVTSVKRHVRYHQHAEYILRVKQRGKPDIYVGRRYDEFAQLHKRIRMELPGKVLAPLPRKSKTNAVISSWGDDTSSVSSSSTQSTTPPNEPQEVSSSPGHRSLLRTVDGLTHKRGASLSSLRNKQSPRSSGDLSRPAVLYREQQRVSLRAFLRTFLHTEQIARSPAMMEFLTGNLVEPNEEELEDIQRRRELDERRLEDQRKFYEIAKQRAAELDIHMEKFRREVVERNGLSKLFQEIRVKKSIAELKPEYRVFAEWLRIEVAATIYHLFLAEDNSPELFAQAKRIHSLVPYSLLKNVIRISNPAAVMAGVLDLFLAQPFGARSLMQRIFGMAIHDGINNIEKSIDVLRGRVGDDVLSEKIRKFVETDENVKAIIRQEAVDESVDPIVAILRSELIEPPLTPEQIGTVFNAYVAWTNAVENVDEEMKQGAELFARLKQLLKLSLRQRDKVMMLQMIEEPTTLQLFKDLFTIFYEPLVRVYKSANVYNSITDFAAFVDDTIKTVEAAQRQDFSADPNQTVQAFIDLCARHEEDFYKFVHEVHTHDNGLFDQLMGWIEELLHFLKYGPRGGGRLDMNALLQGAVQMKIIDKDLAIAEINALIDWQMARKKWHHNKTRQKMATGDAHEGSPVPGLNTFKSSDFGLHEMDLEDLEIEDGTDEDDSDLDDEDDADPISAERRRRSETLRRTAGEPKKPEVVELHKLMPGFNAMLRTVLAE